ncbi:MAG: DUF177 domain-containing protein [Burkholderiales bacterium]
MTGDLRIHPDRLTEKGTLFEGRFRPGDLESLAVELASPEGELRFRVHARLDESRRRVVSCIIEGFVFLTCQSSFETFRHEIAIDDRLVLVATEEELPALEQESDREDFVVADAPLAVRDLVAEAVILALPMVPRKPGAGPAAEESPAPGRESPFAALAGIARQKPK